jgi:hypothetical protein
MIPCALVALLIVSAVLAGCTPPTDHARGDADRKAASARWGIVRDGAVAWLVTPDGERFFSVGVNGVDGGRRRNRPEFFRQNHYRHHHEFVSDTGARLKAWGFNTLGLVAPTHTSQLSGHAALRLGLHPTVLSLGRPVSSGHGGADAKLRGKTVQAIRGSP